MSGYRLFAVDDSDDDLFLLSRALAKATGLTLTATAKDGIAAVSYLEGTGQLEDPECYPLPDLIVLDLKMPELDGFGFLQWLREHPERKCRVVVLTSSVSVADCSRALELGAEAVFVKPVSPAGYLAVAVKLNEWVKDGTPGGGGKESPQ